jgi:hypothetical protein
MAAFFYLVSQSIAPHGTETSIQSSATAVFTAPVSDCLDEVARVVAREANAIMAA